MVWNAAAGISVQAPNGPQRASTVDVRGYRRGERVGAAGAWALAPSALCALPHIQGAAQPRREGVEPCKPSHTVAQAVLPKLEAVAGRTGSALSSHLVMPAASITAASSRKLRGGAIEQ